MKRQYFLIFLSTIAIGIITFILCEKSYQQGFLAGIEEERSNAPYQFFQHLDSCPDVGGVVCQVENYEGGGFVVSYKHPKKQEVLTVGNAEMPHIFNGEVFLGNKKRIAAFVKE